MPLEYQSLLNHVLIFKNSKSFYYQLKFKTLNGQNVSMFYKLIV